MSRPFCVFAYLIFIFTVRIATMRLLDLFFIFMVTSASWMTIIGGSPRKIGPLVLENVASDVLIPELLESWDLNYALARQLMKEDGTDVKDIKANVKSVDHIQTKLEQEKNQISDVTAEEITETSEESKAIKSRVKDPETGEQSQEVEKDMRQEDRHNRLNEGRNSGRTADLAVLQQDIRRIEAKKGEEPGKASQRQRDIEDNDHLNEAKVNSLEKVLANERIGGEENVQGNTEPMPEQAQWKENQETTGSETKEVIEAKQKEDFFEEKKQSAGVVLDVDAQGRKETNVEDREEKKVNVQQKERQKVERSKNEKKGDTADGGKVEDQKAEKNKDGEKGDTAEEGKVEQKSTADIGTNLAGKKVIEDAKQNGGAAEVEKQDEAFENKLEEGAVQQKVEQKVSETETNETTSEGSGIVGKPDSTSDALKLVTGQEMRGQGNEIEQGKGDKELAEKGKEENEYSSEHKEEANANDTEAKEEVKSEAEEIKIEEKENSLQHKEANENDTEVKEEVEPEAGEAKKKKEENSPQHKEEINEKDTEAKEEVESEVVEMKEDRPSDTIDLDGTSVGGALSRQSTGQEDEEYSDLAQEFADLRFKFQGTAEKVAEHLTPDLLKLTDTSKVFFNLANQHIAESFSPLVGKDYAPFLASVISYALLLLPLLVVVILFEHIRALLSLQKILLFLNIYLAAYFTTLLLASFILGSEPMVFFYKNSLSSYIYLQLLQALGYLVYLILQTVSLISSCSSEIFSAKLTSVLQWVVAVLVGLHYFVTIFQRAMATKAPRTSWKVYGIYSICFFILCLFARIKWLKKQYGPAGDEATDKKN